MNTATLSPLSIATLGFMVHQVIVENQPARALLAPVAGVALKILGESCQSEGMTMMGNDIAGPSTCIVGCTTLALAAVAVGNTLVERINLVNGNGQAGMDLFHRLVQPILIAIAVYMVYGMLHNSSGEDNHPWWAPGRENHPCRPSCPLERL